MEPRFTPLTRLIAAYANRYANSRIAYTGTIHSTVRITVSRRCVIMLT